MFSCLIKYKLNPNKLDEFEKYACAWISLIEKYGGTHHGYFIPGRENDVFPNSSFSFSDIGKSGEKNVAFALFSFPTVEAYENYKKRVAKDKKCHVITKHFNETKCFLSYKRYFLKPIFRESKIKDKQI